MGMAAALRNNLLSVYSVALANENSQDKAALLYKHLTSQSFINRVQSISETYLGMINDLEKEKMAMDRIWSNREKQIERLSTNSRQVFNEIGSIVGGQYSGIEILEELGEDQLKAGQPQAGKLLKYSHLEPPLSKQSGERSLDNKSAIGEIPPKKEKKTKKDVQANLF